MDENLRLEVLHADQLTSGQLAEIHALCNRAYEADLEPLFRTFTGTTQMLQS